MTDAHSEREREEERRQEKRREINKERESKSSVLLAYGGEGIL